MKSQTWIHATFLLILLGAGFSPLRSQDTGWTLLDQPGRLLKADMAQTDETGWTHYFSSRQNKLILSIYKNGQNIGEVDEWLSISSGLLNNYGKGANDLSGADYIQSAFWLTFNRYWRIQDANPLTRPVRVRFYFNEQDIRDLEAGLLSSGYRLDSLSDIQFYALEGGSLHPFAIRTRSGTSTLRRFDTGRTATIGKWGDFLYAEFQLQDLSSSGSGGFYIPLEGQQFSISGRITSPNGDPIEDVYVRSKVEGAAVRTTAEGEFTVANLQGGSSYEITPFSQDRPTRMVTVLDLIGLSQHFVRKEKWESPWQQIAADANQSGSVDEKDLLFLQGLILGEEKNFPGDASWQFVPAGFSPQEAASDRRISRLPPGSVRIETLASHVTGVDFKAIKTGNIWREQDFPNEPPSILDPSFTLPNLSTCGGGEILRYDLIVTDFVGIRGFQFTLQWDPEALSYEGVDNFNLPHLDAADFGTAFTSEGKLTVAWYTPDRPNTIKLRDGDVVCTFLFRTTGRAGRESVIRFADDPTPIQVLRDNLSTANVFFTPGNMQMQGESSMEIDEITIRPASCAGRKDGAISIQVKGGMPPYRYSWSNGMQAPSIYNLTPGKYQVTISDGTACPIVSDALEVTGPEPVMLHSHNVRQISCPGQSDGAISFKVSGGNPPYRYEWSNGAITPWVGQLSEGTYSVTVSDQLGCSREEVFTIDARQDIQMNYSITSASAPFANDGAVVIRDLIGSPGPQTFEWDTGMKGNALHHVPPGQYEVQVKDAGGCAFTFHFEVPYGPAPQILAANLPKELLPPGVSIPVDIESPEAQTVHFKVYDDKSHLLYQQIVEVTKGKTRQYFQTPSREGSYLIQILPPRGSICSLRFRTR